MENTTTKSDKQCGRKCLKYKQSRPDKTNDINMNGESLVFTKDNFH